MAIKILNGALDKGDGEDGVLRGRIDVAALGIHPDSQAVIEEFFHLTAGMHGEFRVDDYQREVLSGKRRDKLLKAYHAGERVPDVELGLRGDSIKRGGNGTFIIEDPVYIIDGLQRIAAAREVLEETDYGLDIRLGATIYLNSNQEWERARFRTLNLERTPLSPNVHLRNLRATHKSTARLYDLTNKRPGFVMNGRVQWGQNARKNECVTALGFYRTVSMLHWRFGGGAKIGSAELQANSIEATMSKIGQRQLISNVMTFYNVVDQCWNIRDIVYVRKASHMKQSFLVVLAELFTRHGVFWNERNALQVDSATRKKLSQFPLRDPAVRDMISSSGAGSLRALYSLLLDHVNKSRRTNRLEADYAAPDIEEVA